MTPAVVMHKLKVGCHGMSANLTLNLPVNSEYVVAWNQITVVAIIICIYPCRRYLQIPPPCSGQRIELK